MAAHRVEQRQLDGLAGGVGGVDDAREGVPAFEGQRKIAVGAAVEGNVDTLEQDAAQRIRSVFGHDVHGARVAVPVSGAQDIFGQERRRVIFALVDDASLRPVGVGVLRLGGAGDDCDAHAGVGEDERSGRPGDAAADDEDVGFQMLGHVCVSACRFGIQGFCHAMMDGGIICRIRYHRGRIDARRPKTDGRLHAG